MLTVERWLLAGLFALAVWEWFGRRYRIEPQSWERALIGVAGPLSLIAAVVWWLVLEQRTWIGGSFRVPLILRGERMPALRARVYVWLRFWWPLHQWGLLLVRNVSMDRADRPPASGASREDEP